MNAVEYDPRALQKHIARTYLGLRVGIVFIGAVLPVVLWAGAALRDHLTLQGSMSAYYYTDMRDIFVGALATIGVFLYLYKGFSKPENWALNAAGLMAVLVAFFPTRAAGEQDSLRPLFHNCAAVTLFLCIAYVSIFRASDTLSLIRDTRRAERLRSIYRTLGIAMIVSPIVAVALSFLFRPGDPNASLVFFVEWAGIWAFAAYWFAKSREIAETNAELVALEQRMKAVPSTGRKLVPGKMIELGGNGGTPGTGAPAPQQTTVKPPAPKPGPSPLAGPGGNPAGA